MNGILNILKPPGMTSFDVAARVRSLLKAKKTGHTGTLDPLAAGVLPVCTGSATKAIEFMMDKDKLYRAELTLGITTDTQDASGEVLSEKAVTCSDEEIHAAVKAFEGKSAQVPPMYSAIKVDGRKLYEMAREGQTIDRASRDIEIYSADVLRIKRDEKVRILFDVHCSKGTYIRTLCEDIGEKLGCGGHMSFLLRKRAGAFDLSSAVTLEELKQAVDAGNVASLLISAEKVFDGYGAIKLDGAREKKFRNGVHVELSELYSLEDGLVKVYNTDDAFIALGEVFEEDNVRLLKSRKFF